MTLNEVRDIAARGESDQVEFERTTSTLSTAIETVCAMLNGSSGYVLIGVKDDGTSSGSKLSGSKLPTKRCAT